MTMLNFRRRLVALLGTVGVLVSYSVVPNSLVSNFITVEDPVLVGTGDISSCGGNNDEATAKLLDSIAGTVFTTGDNAYPDGADVEFANCYAPTWGRHKSRTRPTPGNHDYHTLGATGYYNYFGAAAGDPNKGYYSYDQGAWHIVVLNSQCAAVGGCQAGSPQEKWLRADLAAHPAPCTLAYWHHPRFSSGQHGNQTFTQPLWQALYDAGADIVLNGHDHNYERFAPQNPTGGADPERGIREFVVGTGGASLRPFATIKPNSEVRNSDTRGVLKLTLHDTGYDWQFIPVAGSTFFDAGSAACVTLTQPSPSPSPSPTSSPSPSPTPSNLLKNPGFELDANNDTRPDSWTSNSKFTRRTASVNGGTYAGRFFATDNTGTTISQTVSNLTAGTKYNFSGWVNIPAQNDTTFTFKLQVRWRNASNTTIGTTTVKTYSAATSGWTQATATSLVAPTGTTNGQVRMVVSSLNGTIYVDDFVFQQQ